MPHDGFCIGTHDERRHARQIGADDDEIGSDISRLRQYLLINSPRADARAYPFRRELNLAGKLLKIALVRPRQTQLYVRRQVVDVSFCNRLLNVNQTDSGSLSIPRF